MEPAPTNSTIFLSPKSCCRFLVCLDIPLALYMDISYNYTAHIASVMIQLCWCVDKLYLLGIICRHDNLKEPFDQ